MIGGPRSTPVYIAGNHSRAWHIARYKSTGYGVHAVCGASWNEGQYVELDDGNRPLDGVDIVLCRSCEKAANRV